MDIHPLSYKHTRRDVTNILGLVLLFIFALANSVVAARGWLEHDWWISNSITSITLALFAGAVLYLHYHFNNPTNNIDADHHTYLISNEALLERFKQFHTHQNNQQGNSPPLYLPTGLLITFLEITHENQLILEGFIWQKYDKKFNIKKEVSLLNATTFSTEKAYEIDNGNDTIIGWHFKAVALNFFDFWQYPFDKQLLTLNFYHPEIEKNIVLTPDFLSYEQSDNHSVLKHNVQITSWEFNDTFFYYYLPNTKTSMGIRGRTSNNTLPDFYFAMSISRDILSTVGMVLLPLAIIAIITFFVLLQTSVGRETSRISTILPQLSAIFFASVISHQSLRGSISNINTVIYIEYYYFLTYALLKLVAINGVVYLSTKRENSLLFYRENLVIKLLYWPTLFLLALLTTL